MNRADVYRHIKDLKENNRQIFVEDRPYEKMVWNYVDQFLDEGFIEKTREFELAGRDHYWFKITVQGEDLHKRVSFALNYGPNDISQFVDSAEAKKEISNKIDDALRTRSFPAPSFEDIKKALESLKKEVKEPEDEQK